MTLYRVTTNEGSDPVVREVEADGVGWEDGRSALLWLFRRSETGARNLLGIPIIENASVLVVRRASVVAVEALDAPADPGPPAGP